MADASSGSGTQAVDRAALLVSTVVHADEPLTFADLQEASGLAKSTTSRMLAALERGGLLERDDGGSYVAGCLFWLYAARHDPWEELVRLARPAMERIGAETHETVHLSVTRGEKVVQVAQVDSRFLLGTRDWTEVDVPAHTSALGKVFYAWGGLPVPDTDLERHTDATIVAPDRLRRDGAATRKRGYAVTRDELEVGLTGVAVPVLGPRDDVVAALGISGPTDATGGPARRARPQPVVPRHAAVRAAARPHFAPTHQGADRQGGRGMTRPEEVLQGLYDETLVGNAPRVLELTEEGLTLGMEPQTLLFDALIPSLEEVGARFERGDFFVPEMLIAGRAMAGAMERLRPLLVEGGIETIGKFLMGTVKGDVHDIGKNLVNIMLEGAGFEVIDLGVQVAPEKFVAAIVEHRARHRRLLGVPHDHDADVQGQHERPREGRPPRQGRRDGRRCAGHPGVRRRRGRRRIRRRRLRLRQARQGPDEPAAREGPRMTGPGIAEPQETVLRSATKEVVIGHGHRFCLIGERINPTGRRIFQEQLRAGDFSAIERDVKAQVEGGADVLDVNMGVPLTDEPELLAKAIQLVQSLTDLPICIDSSVVEALEAGLSVYQGRALVNSITAEDDRMAAILPLVKKYDAAVIALPNDHDEIPMEWEKRLDLVAKIVRVATEEYGIAKADIVIDPLAMPIGADTGNSLVTMEAMRQIRDQHGLNMTCGASNVSFGMPDRHTLGAAWLPMAMTAGLTSAIMDTRTPQIVEAVKAADVFLNHDDWGMAWIAAHRAKAAASA